MEIDELDDGRNKTGNIESLCHWFSIIYSRIREVNSGRCASVVRQGLELVSSI